MREIRLSRSVIVKVPVACGERCLQRWGTRRRGAPSLAAVAWPGGCTAQDMQAGRSLEFRVVLGSLPLPSSGTFLSCVYLASLREEKPYKHILILPTRAASSTGTGTFLLRKPGNAVHQARCSVRGQGVPAPCVCRLFSG